MIRPDDIVRSTISQRPNAAASVSVVLEGRADRVGRQDDVDGAVARETGILYGLVLEGGMGFAVEVRGMVTSF